MTKSKIINIVLIIALIFTASTSIIFYIELSKINNNPQEVAQKQADSIIQMIGKLIVLPEGETPSVIKITDPTKLKDQPFFANSKAGDYVLLYSDAEKAVLYDPIMNKVVDIAPFDVSSNSASSTVTSSQ